MEYGNNGLKVYLAVILGNVFWGVSNVVTKIAVSVADPEILLTCRFLLAFAVLTGLMAAQGERPRLKKKSWKSFVALMILIPLVYLGEGYGLAYANATFAGVIGALGPIAGAVLGAIFLKEYPSRRKIFYSLFPIAGVIIITLNGSRLGVVKPFGVFMLFAAMLFSSAGRTANRGASRDYSPLERTWATFLTCTLFFTAMALIKNQGDLSAYREALSHREFVISFVILALLSSVAAHLLVNYGYRYLSVLGMSVMAMLQYAMSIFSGVLVLHEPLTPAILLGVIMILGGVYMVNHS